MFKKILNPLDVYDKVEDFLAPLQGKTVNCRGVLLFKENRKKRSYFQLRTTAAEKGEDNRDCKRIFLQFSVAEGDAEALMNCVNYEVILQGELSFHIGYDSACVVIVLEHPQVLKRLDYQPNADEEALAELQQLFTTNPKQKPRGEAVIEFLSRQLQKNQRLRIAVIGPSGKGTDDIFNEYGRAGGLQHYVELERIVRSLNPASYIQKDIDRHFESLAKFIEEKASSGQYDLICLARGGGNPNELSTLNNKVLCSAVINSPIPICASIAHATDVLWLKLCSDLFTNVPAVFIGELIRAVNAVYPNAVRVQATEIAAGWQRLGELEDRGWNSWLPILLFVAVVASLAFCIWKLLY